MCGMIKKFATTMALLTVMASSAVAGYFAPSTPFTNFDRIGNCVEESTKATCGASFQFEASYVGGKINTNKANAICRVKIFDITDFTAGENLISSWSVWTNFTGYAEFENIYLREDTSIRIECTGDVGMRIHNFTLYGHQ